MSSTSIHLTDLIPVVGTILSETQIPHREERKKKSVPIASRTSYMQRLPSSTSVKIKTHKTMYQVTLKVDHFTPGSIRQTSKEG